MSVTYYAKDPQAVLDYGWDWEEWLNSDVLSTSTWQAEDGITIDTDSKTTTTTTVWLSGGTAGNTYTVTNHVTTQGGRTDERSFDVRVRER